MKKKPLSDSENTYFDQEQIELLRKEPDEYAATAIDARVRAIDGETKGRFVELGMLLDEVEMRELWKYILKKNGNKFKSFDSWIREAAPAGYSTGYLAKSVVRKVRDSQIPMDRAKKIPACNLKVMAKLSPKVAAKESTLKAAEKMPENQFREHIAAKHPSQHIELIRKTTLNFTKSQRTVWDGAVEMAMQVSGAANREEAAEWMAAEYLEAHRVEYKNKQQDAMETEAVLQ